MDHDETPPLEILFSADVKADELHFNAAPENSVVFTGDAAVESTSGSTRTNLPDEVEEHVTYRDVRIHYTIEAKLPPMYDPETEQLE